MHTLLRSGLGVKKRPKDKLLSLIFWNVNGLSKFLDTDATELLADIICISETLCVNPHSSLPPFLRDYIPAWSPAVKEKSRGRGSGGLLTLIQRKLRPEVLDSSPWWIFFKF